MRSPTIPIVCLQYLQYPPLSLSFYSLTHRGTQRIRSVHPQEILSLSSSLTQSHDLDFLPAGLLASMFFKAHRWACVHAECFPWACALPRTTQLDYMEFEDGSEWNIPTTVGWISTKCHVSHRVNCNHFSDPPEFSSSLLTLVVVSMLACRH